MNKLALSDEILLKIEKPARYIGNEVNATYKDLSETDIRFAMCFPDVYEVGMSHLGMQILYDMFNSWSDVWCERVYSPWIDLHKIMKEQNIPLFALESQNPLKDFDFIGITLQYEMCYTNIIQILDLSQIPIIAAERSDNDPIVIGGGPCTYNPEPIADFFDIFYMGEGEVSYRKLLDIYKECKKNNLTRDDFLRKAASIEGMYIPKFYKVEYKKDGTLDSFEPIYPDVPKTVSKTVVMDLNNTYYPTKPIVPYIKAVQDRVVLEIQRGCIRGCRFCQAGMIYRPIRERSLEMLEQTAVKMLENTGHEEMSLSSLSSSDYSQLPELIDYLLDYTDKKKVNISLPSLRVDSFSLDVMSKVQDVRKSSVTFAPEAGTQRMRNVINKGLTKEDILNGCTQAFLGGWTRVKLYFMLGLPSETEEDIKGIAELSNDIAKLYYELIPKENRIGKVQIVSSTSFFVPKPFTPFQWAQMATADECKEKAHICNDAMHAQLNFKSIKYNWHSPDESVLEGAFARGDRKLSKVIIKAYENGCLFDAWTETFSMEPWILSYEQCGIDPYFYTARERANDELFPWDFIDAGVTKSFLLNEWEKSKREEVTPNCRKQCSGCGALKYKGGVCVENKN